MRKLENQEMINLNGGEFLGGLCGGLTLAEGGVGLAAVAVHYGWIAAIPGLGQAAIVVGAGVALSCGAYTIANS